MQRDKSKVCNKCGWWQFCGETEHRGRMVLYGYCLRHAPTAVNKYIFPPTFEDEWCGDWEPKEPAAATAPA